MDQGTCREENGRLLQARDPRVLEFLFGLAPRIEYSLQRKFGPLIAREDLKDIVSDAIVIVFRRGNEFDPSQSNIETWTSRRAHYEALTFIRKNSCISGKSLDQLAYALAFEIETSHTGVSQEFSEKVETFINDLVLSRQIVVRLRYLEELSVEQIAETLGISPGAVRVRLHRAHSDLQRLMEGEEKGEEGPLPSAGMFVGLRDEDKDEEEGEGVV